MNPVLGKSLLLRLILTPLLYLTRHNVLYSVLMLTALDIIDCNPLVLKLFPPQYQGKGCSYDSQYQILDKSLDIFQYVVAVMLLSPILPTHIFTATIALIVYRIIGMIMYSFNKDNKTFIIFIDFIKEYLLLFALFGQTISVPILSIAITLKVVYEYLMHDKHIFLDLYRIIFE